MNVDNIYDSDSDFEDFVYSGKNIQVVYFDNIEQLKQSEKELDKIVGFDHDSNTIQYIIIKPRID